MVAQDEKELNPSQDLIIHTLIDLAHISRLVGSVPSSPALSQHTVTNALLHRLLLACNAQQGAILQFPSILVERVQQTQQATQLRGTRDILALHYLNEHEAMALFIRLISQSNTIYQLSEHEYWLLWFIPPLDEPESQSSTSTHPYLERDTDYKLLTFLLFGWSGPQSRQQATSSLALLPQLNDAIAATIAHILHTQRMQTLEALADHQAIREMELLKAELLATVSHELRSPLASIKGYAATLLRHEHRISREERHEFLLAINQASDRLSVVIDRLLEMSQLDTDTITLDYTDVDLAHLAHEAIISMQQRFQGHNTTPLVQNTDASSLSRHHPTFMLYVEDQQGRATENGLIIYADRHRLRELFDNLLENAVLYSSEEGHIDVTLRPLAVDDPQAQQLLMERGATPQHPLPIQQYKHLVHIQVRDYGIGIPPAHLERIFERFHRVDTRLTRETNGLGLGLAICKRIVSLHNGLIWATSTYGKGSTFHVLLPITENGVESNQNSSHI
jgi:signal transduction histidine kinase